MRSFLFGVFTGMLAFAAVQQLWRSDETSSPDRQGANPAGRSTEADVGLSRSAASASGRTNPSPKAAGTAIERPGMEPTVELPLASTQPSEPPLAWAAAEQANEEARIEQAYMAMQERRRAREQSAREAETKDAWGYATEQQLQQFLTSHRAADKFRMTTLDCRTTYCELRATGNSPEAIAAFQEVMNEAVQQSWAGLQMSEGGSTSDGASNTMYYILRKE